MKSLTIKKLQEILRNGLRLRDTEFHLQRSGEKIIGSIVSPSFMGMRDLKRQQEIWNLLEKHFGAQSWSLVGMLLAYTPDEWYLDADIEGKPRPKKRSA